MKKYYKNVLILLIVILSFCISCAKKQDSEVTSQGFFMSDTMYSRSEQSFARLQKVKDEIRLFGKIQADNKKLAQVYSVLSGSVIKINVELGDYVKKGQVLAIVRSSEVAGFQKEYLNAKSQVLEAEKNLQVAKDLFSGKLASEKEVVSAQTQLDNVRAELERSREIYGIYNLSNNSEYNIVAPIGGFIMKKNINQGELLRSDQSEVLFSIAEIDEVWATANVNESDISKIKIGHSAVVKTLSFPNERYYGRIDKIFNAIDPETKAMKVRIRIGNDGFKLKPEMNAIITVNYEEEIKLIAVPSSAVIFDKSKNWVMVFKDRSSILTREVILYRQVGDVTYLSSGISHGEKVLSKDVNLIYDALND